MSKEARGKEGEEVGSKERREAERVFREYYRGGNGRKQREGGGAYDDTDTDTDTLTHTDTGTHRHTQAHAHSHSLSLSVPHREVRF